MLVEERLGDAQKGWHILRSNQTHTTCLLEGGPEIHKASARVGQPISAGPCRTATSSSPSKTRPVPIIPNGSSSTARRAPMLAAPKKAIPLDSPLGISLCHGD